MQINLINSNYRFWGKLLVATGAVSGMVISCQALDGGTGQVDAEIPVTARYYANRISADNSKAPIENLETNYYGTHGVIVMGLAEKFDLTSPHITACWRRRSTLNGTLLYQIEWIMPPLAVSKPVTIKLYDLFGKQLASRSVSASTLNGPLTFRAGLSYRVTLSPSETATEQDISIDINGNSEDVVAAAIVVNNTFDVGIFRGK